MKVLQMVISRFLAGVILLCWCAGVLSAQTVISQFSLFDGSSGARSAGWRLSPSAIDQLRGSDTTLRVNAVPLITGAQSDFVLQPMSIFADDARIHLIDASGETTVRPVSQTRAWSGVSTSDPRRAMFLSVSSDDTVYAMVSGDEQNPVTVIEPAPGAAGEYRINPGGLPEMPVCASDVPVPSSITLPATPAQPREGGAAPRNDVVYEIEMMIDVGLKLYNHLGSQSQVEDYLIRLMGACNTIYQRDLGARMTIKHLYVWKTADPFQANHPSDTSTGFTSYDQLYNYQDYVNSQRQTVPFDLAHFLDRSTNLGGLAYINVLSNYLASYRFGVSNVNGASNFPTNINTYHWDTMVLAHEVGHNIGSPHTHCYMPAIDCCATEPTCSGCSVSSRTNGTIMSYCHLHGASYMTMIFHSRCIELMRPKIVDATILAPYGNHPNIEVRGPNGALIASGETQTSTANGTSIEAQGAGGPPVVRTFTIHNTGNANLVLTANPLVSVTGSQWLTVKSQPGGNTIAPGAQRTFEVQFNPGAPGTFLSQVAIGSTDPDMPQYTFAIGGKVVFPGAAQTFTWTGDHAIPDNNPFGTAINLDITGVPGQIVDVNFRFNGTGDCTTAAGAGLVHPRINDLNIALRAPSGTLSWLLQMPPQATGGNLCNLLLDDQPTFTSIQTLGPNTRATYTGSYLPSEPLSRFLGGDPNGRWQLLLTDSKSGNAGSVKSFSIIVHGAVMAGEIDWELY